MSVLRSLSSGAVLLAVSSLLCCSGGTKQDDSSPVDESPDTRRMGGSTSAAGGADSRAAQKEAGTMSAEPDPQPATSEPSASEGGEGAAESSTSDPRDAASASPTNDCQCPNGCPCDDEDAAGEGAAEPTGVSEPTPADASAVDDAGAGVSAYAAGCPDGLPGSGGSCEVSLSNPTCTYGDWPCQDAATCLNGAWVLTFSQCSYSEQPCPAESSECSEQGQWCRRDGMPPCECVYSSTTQQTTWQCEFYAVEQGCPVIPPNGGQACKANDTGCRYDRCVGHCQLITSSCTDGAWENLYADPELCGCGTN
jgi:hypothetical protein